ncbi:MAG: hypothetical protein K2Z81_12430 [Cyanobacteria bacterium]|nr:hypothetical protein [Cyanobacteriota bacterium]
MSLRKSATHALLTLLLWLSIGSIAIASEVPSDWQTYSDESSQFTLQHPPDWQATADSKSGRIDVKNESGASLSVLPFFVAGKTVESLDPPKFFTLLIKLAAPTETWSEPQSMGTNSYRATYSNDSENASAALVLIPFPEGVLGLACMAKSPKGEQAVTTDTFVTMMNSLRQNPDFAANSSTQANSEGFTKFTDPSENSFWLDVPTGWKVEGGLTRVSAIDVRPWVKAVSPDQLVTAFIGDGKISPCTMPSSTGNALGFRVGSMYNGTVIQPYIPARKFAEKYARSNLEAYLSNIQVVAEHDHPDVAAAVNGTVGATKSEAASIKMTAMYGDIPAVAYYLAVTKATVGYGTGMWWVTKLAGVVAPAERDEEALSVILRMLGSYQVNPAWEQNQLRNTMEVSRHYTQVSQRVSQAISDRYWSQQEHNRRMNQAYWDRQTSQDNAANKFTNYILGVEDVQDPSTGTTYQVQYGPQYHYIDPTGTYIVGGDSAPSPEWQQLISLP